MYFYVYNIIYNIHMYMYIYIYTYVYMHDIYTHIYIYIPYHGELYSSLLNRRWTLLNRCLNLFSDGSGRVGKSAAKEVLRSNSNSDSRSNSNR